MNVDAYQLLYYDLGKNFTWDSTGCTCTAIDGASEMPFFFLPPFAVPSQTNVTITVNGQQVLTNVYTASFNMCVQFILGNLLLTSYRGYYDPYNKDNSDSLFDMNFILYVDTSNNLKRTSFVFNMIFMNINTTIDMWNIKAIDSSDLILPDYSCKVHTYIN